MPEQWSPWRTVVWFGVVSMAADLVYEGARSITGPYLASLGASALVVGLVTGAGELAALAFRLYTGPLADRTGGYWFLTFLGYGMTAVCVPLMGVAPFVGGAGLAVASSMVFLERTGKAVRSPSKSTLLAGAARSVGRGRGFAVHKALDQVGAFAGPLIVAGIVALSGRSWLALACLAVPGAVAMATLVVVRRHAGGVAGVETPPAATPRPAGDVVSTPLDHRGERLPREFHLFAAACGAATFGLMTFGVMGYHLVAAGLVTAAVVPVVYAGAMGVEAFAALGTGLAYDRWGGRTLLVLPVVVALVPGLAFAPSLGLVLAGIVLWGLATGVQDSTVKALVADLVPRPRLATAYGAFAAWQGVAALAGGGVAGWLYPRSVLALVVVVGVLQVVASGLLVRVLRRPA